MKNTPNRPFFTLMSLLLMLGLSLAGCTTDFAAPTLESVSATVDTSATTAPTATEAPVAATGDCLVGSWSLIDFAPYMNSVKQNITQKSGNDVTFTSGDYSGKATFVFNADNTSSLITDNFNQSFTMTMSVSDTPIEIPISLTINGTSTSDYTTEADKITFSNQNAGDMLINIDVAGTVSTMDQSLFGDPGTVQLYQYSCVDADTLSLKVIAINDMDLAPLILTRVK